MNKILLKNTVLALLKSAPGLGNVQLRKGLIMIDALYHSFFKETLTGITYIKHWYGPVPDHEAHSELYRMEFSEIKIAHEKTGNKVKEAHYAITEPDFSSFPNRKAIEIIRDVAGFIVTKKAGKLSEITHDTVYENTKMGGVIPIESIYSIEISAEPWTKEEHVEAQSAIKELNESGFDLSPYYA
ncbi:MAG: Panacea domain-containing protein [Treponema sp.]|nr:Panacea domain-containing protein [Treponema sp.]